MVFVLALVGFGSKAGVVPLHVWLPRAHPEAPSHVSALMSGAMVKLGVYGIVRVGWDLLGGGPRWWGVVVLAVGAVSALFGVLHALVSSDLKRLLAYSTTENVGLILSGSARPVCSRPSGNRALAAVAIGRGAAARRQPRRVQGAAVPRRRLGRWRATGTRDLDRLGGLVRRMPVTAATFAVGAFAIAALPPLNGFVSEWLLLQSLVHGLPSPRRCGGGARCRSRSRSSRSPAGLAAATFVKAFGTGFLALPRRRAAARRPRRRPDDASSAWSSLAGVCVVLGVAPTMLGGRCAGRRRARRRCRWAAAATDGVRLRLTGIQAPAVAAADRGGPGRRAVASWRSCGRCGRRSRDGPSGSPTWGCGRSVQTARMEYTATSFAEPLQRVFDDVLRPDLDVDVDHTRRVALLRRGRPLPTPGSATRSSTALYRPVLAAVRRWGRALGGSRTAASTAISAYAFVVLIVVLVVAR